MKIPDESFLFGLLEQPSPVGFEMGGQRKWAAFAKKHSKEVACDAYGSTWATLNGKSEKSVMLEAHADEIGYMVKHITDEGYLYVDILGGSDAAAARGKRLTILGDKGDVSGIIGNTAIHLRARGDEKAPKVHELWVDVGASSKKDVEKLGLRVGHVAVYAEGPMYLGKDKLVCRALDNRIGGYIIAQVLKRISKRKTKPSHDLICLNAVQEEIGGAGARMATYRHMPDVSICIDVTHATDTPGLDAKEVGQVKLGGGPSVTHGSANHPLVVQRLIEVAKEKKITIQHEATSNSTGTDTDQIYGVKQGVPSALVSLPLRCMHSVVETADIKDIEKTIDLLEAFVLSLSQDDDFHHTL